VVRRPQTQKLRPKSLSSNSKRRMDGSDHGPPPVIPQMIKIRREEHYHTHYVGRLKNGGQFMGFIVAIPPKASTHRTTRKVRWYAVLHRFDSSGNHLGTESLFLGTQTYASELNDPEGKLKKMIAKLGPSKYGAVEIKLFSTLIDGSVFGLVDASELEKSYQRIDLVPNGLAFFPPWDGTYET
jgi:hypothetical protein